jgi:hypothetical protein
MKPKYPMIKLITTPSLLFSGLLTASEPINFGEGLKPPSQGVFAPPTLDNTTILTYTNRTISFVITLLTVLAGLFFLYQCLMGGFAWLNAAGDQKKVQEARDRITQGVIGLLLIVGSYAIVGLIGTIFGLDILNPAGFLETTFIPATSPTGP